MYCYMGLSRDFESCEEVAWWTVHVHQRMGAVVQHLVLSAPTILQLYVQVFLLFHQPGCLLKGMEGLTE